MRLDRSLGNVQIFSDFRVVTSLEKQFNHLPFPGLHLAELLFHKCCTSPMRPGCFEWLAIGSLGTYEFGSSVSHFAFMRPKSRRSC